MALLGCLSLVQILFLPGWIALRLLGFRAGRLQSASLIFGVSLVLNHFLVVALTAARSYVPFTLYCVFMVELTIALFLAREGLQKSWAEVVMELNNAWRSLVASLGLDVAGFDIGGVGITGPVRYFRGAAVAGAIAVIVVYAICSFWHFGEIFTQWDAVVSWNRWAIDWANNGWPKTTSLYPQLLPSNISICYVFQGSTEVWCFAKSFQFLFCLMLLVGVFDLAVAMRSTGMMLGAMIVYGLLVAILRFRMLGSGYADVPLAYFVFMSIAMLLFAGRSADAAVRRKYIVLACAMAIGAGLTKQVGLYLIGVLPWFVWQLSYAPWVRFRATWPKLIGVAAATTAFVAPWYCLKLFAISGGRDHDNTLSLILGFHEGRHLVQRFTHAVAMLSAALSPLGLLGVALLLVVALRDRTARMLLAGLIVPWMLIWALGFSYDPRNLAMVLPWIGVVCGLAIERLLPGVYGQVQTAARKNTVQPIQPVVKPASAAFGIATSHGALYGLMQRLRVAHLLLAWIVIWAIGCWRVDDRVLLAKQREQQKEVGVPRINDLLYDYARKHRLDGQIASDYQALAWLPELADRQIVCSPQYLQKLYKTYERPDVHYALLASESCPAELTDYFNRPRHKGTSRLVFEAGKYRFFVKCGLSVYDTATVAGRSP